MKYFLLSIAVFISASFSLCAEISVTKDFTGANIEVEKIEGNDIWVHQELRDTQGWWFYWSFDLNNASGKEIVVHFTNQDPIDYHGPAYSLDGGKTWQWLGKESVLRDKQYKKVSFKHNVPQGAKTVRYAYSYPYHLEDFLAFAKNFEGRKDSLKISPLAVTKQRRQNIFVTFGNPNGKFKMVLTARHHACEATANFVMEGFLYEAMSDSQTGKWLRDNVSFFVVPMVDLDGVQNGDQGKNRRPHDHNRDYIEGIYPSVRAIRSELNKLDASSDAPIMLIDLHAPWIGNRNNYEHRKLYFVYNHDKKSSKNLDTLSAIFEKETAQEIGGIKYFAADGIPFGIEWNNFKGPRSFKNWGLTLKNYEIATTLEIPYSDIRTSPISDCDLRNLGRTLARSCMTYFKSAYPDKVTLPHQ